MSENPYQSPTIPDAMSEDRPQVRSHVDTDGQTFTALDCFGVVVRSIGLILIVMGLGTGLFMLTETVTPSFETFRGAVRITVAIRAVGYILGGAGLIRFAPGIVNLCYTDWRPGSQDEVE